MLEIHGFIRRIKLNTFLRVKHDLKEKYCQRYQFFFLPQKNNMEEEAESKQKTLAMTVHNTGDSVFVRAIHDVEILASCVTNQTDDGIYSHTCGKYLLKANDEVLLPIPPDATPNIHVRLTPHSGTLEQLPRDSNWTHVNLIEERGRPHSSGPISEPGQY